MKVYLIRHGDALERAAWSSSDTTRPLTPHGELQAYEIAEWFKDVAVSAIRTSPTTRCMETVMPLAEAKGMSLTPLAKLGEGLNPQTLVKMIEQPNADGIVICSHGDMIPEALRLLEMRGCEFPSVRHRCETGSIWMLDLAPDFCGTATYVPPSR